MRILETTTSNGTILWIDRMRDGLHWLDSPSRGPGMGKVFRGLPKFFPGERGAKVAAGHLTGEKLIWREPQAPAEASSDTPPVPDSNLVSSWIAEQKRRGRSVTMICQILADQIGLVVTPSRLREWEDGRRPLPHAAYNVMLYAVLVAQFSERSEDKDQLSAGELFNMLALPLKRRAGDADS